MVQNGTIYHDTDYKIQNNLDRVKDINGLIIYTKNKKNGVLKAHAYQVWWVGPVWIKVGSDLFTNSTFPKFID